MPTGAGVIQTVHHLSLLHSSQMYGIALLPVIVEATWMRRLLSFRVRNSSGAIMLSIHWCSNLPLPPKDGRGPVGFSPRERERTAKGHPEPSLTPSAQIFFMQYIYARAPGLCCDATYYIIYNYIYYMGLWLLRSSQSLHTTPCQQDAMTVSRSLSELASPKPQTHLRMTCHVNGAAVHANDQESGIVQRGEEVERTDGIKKWSRSKVGMHPSFSV